MRGLPPAPAEIAAFMHHPAGEFSEVTAEDRRVLSAIVGPRGVIDAATLPPMLVELRGRWPGATPLALAPARVDDVAAIVRHCASRRLALTPQGGNTGLVGGQMPQGREILLSLSRLNAVRDVAAEDGSMIAEAGVTLAAAQAAAEAKDRLFPLSIGSEGTCQIGGVVSTNAGGVNVLRYGTTRDLVLGLEVVLPSGEIWHGLKRLRKDNTGYDLKQLFIGGEGTLGVVTAAALKLFPRPREKMVFVAGLASPEAALALLTRAQQESGGLVSSFELMSRAGVALVAQNIPGARDPLASPHPWLALVEFSAGRAGVLRAIVETTLEAALAADEIADAVIAESEAQSAAFWRMRHTMTEAMRPEGAQAKFDVSAPISLVGAFLRAADKAVTRACPGARIIAFGHAGDGNIHYDILQPTDISAETFEARRGALETAVYTCIDDVGGSISAEHGVGLARRDDIARRKSPTEIAALRAVKCALDPLGIMNPGKML